MQCIGNNISFQRDINLQQRVFQWLMLILDEMPKGKQDTINGFRTEKSLLKVHYPLLLIEQLLSMNDLILLFEISLNN